jgi:rifampin ADP-ribosylating transferase
LTDKKFPGNPTKSYRSGVRFGYLVRSQIGKGHSAAQLKAMKEHLERLKQLGIEAIED